MGVDVYGVSPKLNKELPRKPDDDAQPEEFEMYWQDLQDFEEANPGYRFSSSWWTWRPLQIEMVKAALFLELDIPTEEICSLGYNDGVGISDPKHCIAIAKHFDGIIKEMESNDHESLYLATGSWNHKTIDAYGNIVSTSVFDKEILDQLDKYKGDTFFSPPVLNDVEYHSSHSISLERLKQFTAFLKECNGFVIY